MQLVIAIPTYNRPAFLRKTLESLSEQVSIFNKDVGIFVADDHPLAINREIVEQTKQRYPSALIEYIHNPKNLGIDENIKNCIIFPKSRFVWLLGEDDIIVNNSIGKALRIIQEQDPAFIFANYIYSDDQHQMFARNAVISELPDNKLILFDNFIEKNIHLLGFIGGCIIKQSTWSMSPNEKFKGSFYTHVGGIIESCLGKNIVVMHDISVLNRAENIQTFTWSKSTFQVYFSFFDVLRSSSLSQNKILLNKCINTAQKLFSVYNLYWLIAKRADGVYDFSVYQTIYRQDNNVSFLWKLFAILIAIAPRPPLKLLRSLHLMNRFRRDSIK